MISKTMSINNYKSLYYKLSMAVQQTEILVINYVLVWNAWERPYCWSCFRISSFDVKVSLIILLCSYTSVITGKCEAGQILDNTGACEDCGMDTYQPDELPKSDTTCLPCNANTNSPQKGTMDVKSTSVDKCIRKFLFMSYGLSNRVCVT